jgi:hypothetical protein
MNHRIRVLGCLLISFAAAAVQGAAPGIYGEIDTRKFPRPPLVNDKPIVIDVAARGKKAKPLYLHVAPSDTTHWYTKCHTYNACSQPVYFVTEGWFKNVYLPAIGSRDGREQHYRIDTARKRASERDLHDAHGEE